MNTITWYVTGDGVEHDTREEALAHAEAVQRATGHIIAVEQVEHELCHHGLSAWLCEDPINHYPSDPPGRAYF